MRQQNGFPGAETVKRPAKIGVFDVSKQNGFPRADAVKRRAMTGLQDDTYLIKSPFLSRQRKRSP